MKKKTASGLPSRQDRRIEEFVHDTYMTRNKLHEPAVCRACGVVFHGGCWQWMDKPPAGESHGLVCPACQRIRDKYPAGWMRISGNFKDRYEYEILQMAQHQEEADRQKHPMHRIMDITRDNDETLITTTDIHLPRRICEAIHHAYQGSLEFEYEEDSYRLRVGWKRDA